jgi:hypothetical protein
MNKTVIFVGIIIFFIISWLIGFINTLHDEVDVTHGMNEKTSFINGHGDETLSLNNLSMKEKKRLWNNSNLKIEMLQLFPHFIEMKTFVEDNIDDDSFKKALLSNIEDVEGKYIGASISADMAKASLSDF